MVKPGHNTALALSKCFKLLLSILIVSKYCESGTKLIEVPVFLGPMSPTFLRSEVFSPPSKLISNL